MGEGVKTECTAADFVPVFGQTDAGGKSDTALSGSDETVLFIAGDGTLSYPEAGGALKAFRAYIQLKGAAAGL